MKKMALLQTLLCFFVLLESQNVWAQDTGERVKVLVAYYSATGNTEVMAKGVVAGIQEIKGSDVLLKRVEQVKGKELFAADAVIVGSPVYWANMAAPVKAFFDNWQLQFGVFPELKMKNKIGAAFSTGGQVSGGKELTMLTILAAMLGNHMIVVSGGGAFGASATTERHSVGIQDWELEQAKELGRRVARVTHRWKQGLQNNLVEN